MLRQQKNDSIGELREIIVGAAGALFLDYTGLTVANDYRFRQALRGTDVRYRVVKNSLMARAIAETPFAGARRLLKGTPTGLVWGASDPVAMAKAVFDFVKDCDQLRVKGGVVEACELDAGGAAALAKMPGRSELQASILGQALAPGRTIASAIAAPGQRIAGAVAALAERLESD